MQISILQTVYLDYPPILYHIARFFGGKMFNRQNRNMLLRLARESIAEHLTGQPSITYQNLLNEEIQEDLLDGKRSICDIQKEKRFLMRS